MPEELTSRSKRIEISATGQGGRALALIPVGVALLLGALLMPRAAVPDEVPIPVADVRALDHVAAHDRELAAEARRNPLSGEVRALGSAIRNFNTLQAKNGDSVDVGAARRALDEAMPPAMAAGTDKLVILRAAQLEAFLDEVKKFEATGKESEELLALGGPFVQRMRDAGWCDEKNHVLLDDAQRRVAFKATWSALVNLDTRPEMKPSIDETRALFALYLQHPHAPEAMREQIRASRKAATDPRVCADLAAREAAAVSQWRLDKLKKLGSLDSSYPLAYAVGIEQFRRGNHPAAAEAFRTWLEAHPNGPYALRARNYLKASIEAAAF